LAEEAAFDGPHALGVAAFAGFPALEELDLACVQLRVAGAARLASGRWPRLRRLCLSRCHFSGAGAGVVALARGEFPALERLDLRGNLFFRESPALEDARRWPPALEELLADAPMRIVGPP
jgi:hypothetical protein